MLAAVIRTFADNGHRIIVRDADSGRPIENVLAVMQGDRNGYFTDSTGTVEFRQLVRNSRVRVSLIGYEPAVITLSGEADSTVVEMKLIGIELSEVEVNKRREHYSKRDNPAVRLMENVRRHAAASDPRSYDYLNFEVYEKITLAMTGDRILSEKKKSDKFNFLKDYIEPSVFRDTPVLNLSLKEKIASRHYRRNPKSDKEIVRGIRRIGVDDIIDQESMQVLLADLLAEIDIFGNDIAILRTRFVSPLSRIGADFYKYYITDTISVDGTECIELSFVPRVSETAGFTGKMYIVNDSTFFVKQVGLTLPRDINLNFVEKFLLTQTFARDTLGKRQLLSDNLAVLFSVIPGTQGIYASRNSYYHDYNTEIPDVPELHSSLANSVSSRSAYLQNEDFWVENRAVPLSDSENRLEEMICRLRSDRTYHGMETALKIIVSGYIPTVSPDSESKFDIGPWNTLVSGNDIEGVRLRLGGMTTAALSPRWFAEGYIAYGTKDHTVKYGAELEYSFHDKLKHANEFPIHSISLSTNYDVDKLGQNYLFTSADNFVLSLTRIKNKLMTYKSTTGLHYTLELENNFSIRAGAERSRQYDGPYLPFNTIDGSHFSHFDISSLTLELRYAPGEKFYQSRRERIPISRDAPVFTLSHRYGPDGILGNSFGVNKTEISFQKRFWFSAFGHLDVIAKGGHIWNKVPYPLLLMPNSNLSYTVQPESFALLNPMEFISDSDVSLFLTYWANGTILNRIPFIKRFKLREVFSFRGYLGHLSPKNIPSVDNGLYVFPTDALAAPMHCRPYMEVSVGLDNIFRIFRLDYVWRLNYLDHPGVSKGGFRVALHFSL